jgi:ubiquinol-cytochrome c reductase iron-sulfur subunit
MNNEGVDSGRRRFLTVATAGFGAVGAATVVWPFLASLKPSAKAQAAGAPVKAAIDHIEEGQQVTFVWRGLIIWVLHRSADMVTSLQEVIPQLSDPDSDQDQQPAYCKNATRSIKPEYLVLNGKCTHLGCSPSFKPQHPAPEIDPNWVGGYLCPCHGSKYDLAGRVFKSMPAPLNMLVPPHRYESDSLIVIGEDQVKV